MDVFFKWCWLLCLTAAAWEDLRSRQVSFVILFIGFAVGITSMCLSGIWEHVLAGIMGLIMVGLSKITGGALGEGDGWFYLFSACYWNIWEIGGLFLGGLSVGFVWATFLLMNKKNTTIPFLACTWPIGVWMVCR